MLKLKTILHSSKIFYIVFIVAIIYALLLSKYHPKDSLYHMEDDYFKVQIMDIYIDGNFLKLSLKGREKLVGTYYFITLEEKNTFIDNYHLGDYIEVTGKLTRPSNNTLPNTFNYKQYLYNEGIYYILKIDNYHKIKDNSNLLYGIKNKVIERINRAPLSSSYLHTFILGNDSYLNENVKDVYTNIGITHLFAISGMHISLISGILMSILKLFRLNTKIRYIVVDLFLLFYMILLNCSPSIVRACCLFIFLSIDNFLDLKLNKFSIFLLAISFIIFINPYIIFKVGFLFSSIISGSLIKFNNLIKKRRHYLSKMLMTSFIALIVSFPICIYYFYQINIGNILFNIIFVPFVSILIFPLSIITLILPIMDKILYFLIIILEKVGKLCNYIPTMLIFKKVNIIVYMIYYLVIFLILRGKKLPIIIFLAMVIMHYNSNYFFKSSYVIILDVGQGDSILIHSDNRSILIDTGGRMNYYKDSWQERKHSKGLFSNTITLLKSLGIRKLDYLILTHGDYDHMGEAINLVSNFKVNRVIFNNDKYNQLEQKLLKILQKEKISYYQNIKQLNVASLKLCFLNTKVYDNENDNSIVLYTELNHYKFLFMGDASITREQDILAKYNLKNIDFLKVGHHGSDTSSSKAFIDAINPKYSLISVGKNNRYGHPKDRVLDILRNSQIYRTDIDGSIQIKLKRDSYSLRVYPS